MVFTFSNMASLKNRFYKKDIHLQKSFISTKKSSKEVVLNFFLLLYWLPYVLNAYLPQARCAGQPIRIYCNIIKMSRLKINFM